MTPYLIKMALCALLFFAVYFLILKTENMHRFNRFYLLGSLLFSLFIPFVSLEYVSTPFPVWDQYVPMVEMGVNGDFISDGNVDVGGLIVVEEVSSYPSAKVYTIYIYMLVSAILLIRCLYNIFRLLLLINKHEVVRYKDANLVLLNRRYPVFSFWNYVFVQKDQFNAGEVKPEIIAHELAHVRQRHTLDVLFVEVLTVLFWFNPVIYLYKRYIKLNHEFLADEQVIRNTNNIIDYQLILFNEIKKYNKLKLASYFNYLITKKRFIMMTKRTSSRIMLWKGGVSLLAILIAFCFFSIKTKAQEAGEVAGVAHFSGYLSVVPESGISAREMEEYKMVVNEYLDAVKDDKITWKSMSISDEDMNMLYPLYIKMTKEQRGEKPVLLRFVGPLSPLQLRAPNNDEWRACKSAENKHIWLDGEEVSSEMLKSYSRHNIAYFLVSGRSSGLQQSYLWTQKGIEEYQSKYKDQIPLSELLEIRPNVGFQLSFVKPISQLVK